MATYEWLGGTGGFQTGANWSPSGPPGNGDTAIFNQRGTLGLTGADHSSITLTNLIIYKSFTLGIGDTTTAFKVGATNVQIGLNPDPSQSFSGPSQVNLDLAGIASGVVIYDSGQSAATPGYENILIKGTHTNNTFSMVSGTASVGIATKTGDTAYFATISANAGRLNIGSGCTCPSMTLGNTIQCTSYTGPTALTMTGSARLTTYGDFGITTATINGGTWVASHRKSSGASITTLNRNGGVIDFSLDPRALTITTCNEGAGTIKVFSSSQVTFTATVQSNGNFLSRTVSLS